MRASTTLHLPPLLRRHHRMPVLSRIRPAAVPSPRTRLRVGTSVPPPVHTHAVPPHPHLFPFPFIAHRLHLATAPSTRRRVGTPLQCAAMTPFSRPFPAFLPASAHRCALRGHLVTPHHVPSAPSPCTRLHGTVRCRPSIRAIVSDHRAHPTPPRVGSPSSPISSCCAPPRLRLCSYPACSPARRSTAARPRSTASTPLLTRRSPAPSMSPPHSPRSCRMHHTPCHRHTQHLRPLRPLSAMCSSPTPPLLHLPTRPHFSSHNAPALSLPHVSLPHVSFYATSPSL